MLRTIRLLAVLLAALLGGVWAYAWVTRAPDEGLGEAFAARLGQIFGGQVPLTGAGGIQLPQGRVLGGPFSLVNQAGQPVTERDYAGGWMLVYFGYSYCPDVCPTELGTMVAAVDLLGEAGKAVTPVFITVDPQRDTPAVLADYVARFHPRLQGLTGTPEQIAAAARAYGVYYARAQRPDMTDYLMDHTSLIYLVGPDGRVRSFYRRDLRPEDIAAGVAAQMGAKRPG